MPQLYLRSFRSSVSITQYISTNILLSNYLNYCYGQTLVLSSLDAVLCEDLSGYQGLQYACSMLLVYVELDVVDYYSQLLNSLHFPLVEDLRQISFSFLTSDCQPPHSPPPLSQTKNFSYLGKARGCNIFHSQW